MKRFTKLFNTKATSIDEEGKTIRFKISDNKPDRMGEVVDQATWKFMDYLKNPILLWGHNPDEPENVLGTTLSLDVEADATYATVQLDEDINPKAGLVWRQLMRGTLRTVSVGFINHTYDTEDDQAVLKDNELLEISIVPIPANPRAIALAFKEGSISHKDARWLLEGYRKEADLLETELKAQPEQLKEKNVDEVKQQLATITETMTKMAEAIETNQKAVDERLTALTEQVTEVQKAQTTQEPEQDPAPQPNPQPDPAKGGEHDQPGAGEGEFDPNAELTPEQEAAMREALELEAAA